MHYNDTAMATARSVIPHASPHKPTRVLADHTFFQQPHLAWPAVASPRMDNVDYDTGFAGLGPLVRTDCGSDGHGTGTYDKVREIYSVFTGALCPAGGQLVSDDAAGRRNFVLPLDLSKADSAHHRALACSVSLVWTICCISTKNHGQSIRQVQNASRLARGTRRALDTRHLGSQRQRGSIEPSTRAPCRTSMADGIQLH